MTKDRAKTTKQANLTDQDLDEAVGGSTASTTATIEPTYTMFFKDGTPCRSAGSVLGKRSIVVDAAP